MSYVRVWVHAVWGTKNREPLLAGEIRSLVLDHIRENAKRKNIHLIAVGGYCNHLHCLFGLNAGMTVSKVLQLLKGESARWVNQERISRQRLEWANEYFAASVSESGLEAVRRYVMNQEEHHRRRSHAEEVEAFLRGSDLSDQG